MNVLLKLIATFIVIILMILLSFFAESPNQYASKREYLSITASVILGELALFLGLILIWIS